MPDNVSIGRIIKKSTKVDPNQVLTYSCCRSGCRRPGEAQLERPTYPVDFSLISERNLMKIVYLHSYYY